MRPFNVMLVCCIGLLIGLAAIIGCGSGGDLLDEPGTRYNAYAVPQDGDEDTQEIDVWQGDCNGTPEDFWPFDVKIVIEADSTAADFTVVSYDVYFRPNEGTYCDADTVIGCDSQDLSAAELPVLTGTVLNPRHFTNSDPVIQSGNVLTLDGLLVWTQGDKYFYGNTAINVDPLNGNYVAIDGITVIEKRVTADLTYDMQVVLHCRSAENEDFTITTPWTPVHFADFNNC